MARFACSFDRGRFGPALDGEPKGCVPLPPLLLPEALDWVLCQVVPDYEPAPWPSVVAALSSEPAGRIGSRTGCPGATGACSTAAKCACTVIS